MQAVILFHKTLELWYTFHSQLSRVSLTKCVPMFYTSLCMSQYMLKYTLEGRGRGVWDDHFTAIKRKQIIVKGRKKNSHEKTCLIEAYIQPTPPLRTATNIYKATPLSIINIIRMAIASKKIVHGSTVLGKEHTDHYRLLSKGDNNETSMGEAVPSQKKKYNHCMHIALFITAAVY